MTIIAPAIASALVIVMAFLIPSKSGERITFTVTIMLSLSVYLLLLASSLPLTASPPLISRLLLGLVLFAAMAVVCNIVSVSVFLQGDSRVKYKNRADKPTISLFFSWFQRKGHSAKRKRRPSRVSDADSHELEPWPKRPVQSSSMILVQPTPSEADNDSGLGLVRLQDATTDQSDTDSSTANSRSKMLKALKRRATSSETELLGSSSRMQIPQAVETGLRNVADRAQDKATLKLWHGTSFKLDRLFSILFSIGLAAFLAFTIRTAKGGSSGISGGGY